MVGWAYLKSSPQDQGIPDIIFMIEDKLCFALRKEERAKNGMQTPKERIWIEASGESLNDKNMACMQTVLLWMTLITCEKVDKGANFWGVRNHRKSSTKSSEINKRVATLMKYGWKKGKFTRVTALDPDRSCILPHSLSTKPLYPTNPMKSREFLSFIMTTNAYGSPRGERRVSALGECTFQHLFYVSTWPEFGQLSTVSIVEYGQQYTFEHEFYTKKFHRDSSPQNYPEVKAIDLSLILKLMEGLEEIKVDKNESLEDECMLNENYLFLIKIFL